MQGLTHLTDLRVDHNRLTSLPDEIGKCVRLTELRVAFNMLTQVTSGS